MTPGLGDLVAMLSSPHQPPPAMAKLDSCDQSNQCMSGCSFQSISCDISAVSKLASMSCCCRGQGLAAAKFPPSKTWSCTMSPFHMPACSASALLAVSQVGLGRVLHLYPATWCMSCLQVAKATVAILPIVFLSEMGDGFNGACGGGALFCKTQYGALWGSRRSTALD